MTKNRSSLRKLNIIKIKTFTFNTMLLLHIRLLGHTTNEEVSKSSKKKALCSSNALKYTHRRLISTENKVIFITSLIEAIQQKVFFKHEMLTIAKTVTNNYTNKISAVVPFTKKNIFLFLFLFSLTFIFPHHAPHSKQNGLRYGRFARLEKMIISHNLNFNFICAAERKASSCVR